MVVSEKLFSPQDYVERITGKCFILRGDDDANLIEQILVSEGFVNLWSFPLSEIEHIAENNLDVVLVDCMVYDEEKHEFVNEYRWFEVPEDMRRNFEENGGE